MPSRHSIASPQGKLLPVRMTAQGGSVTLRAGGRSLRFDGPLVTLMADGALRSTTMPREGAGGLLTVHHEVFADSPGLLREVRWFAGRWQSDCQQVVASTSLQDSFLFLRVGDVSFFVSLDFPYSRIGDDGVTYPPHVTIKAGNEPWIGHSLTVGACRLTSRQVGKFDAAEIEAASAYVELRFPMRFNRPMFTSTCITNRLTECREGRIYYSMQDNPTLTLGPQLLEEDVRLMGRIGVEWFQVFEGMFDWPQDDRPGKAMRKLSRLGRKVSVRLGDYIHPGELYCPHYNYEHRHVDKPQWRRLETGNKPPQLCLGHPEYFTMLRKAVVQHNRKFGHEFICLDMLRLAPCHATDHGHPVGDVYQQVRNLMQLMDDVSALSPDYLVWTNSGNWLQLAPKLVWHNPNVYLSDPHVRGYVPTLSLHKLMGDNRREQMVTVHEGWFVPYRSFCNCEYYAFPASRIPDIKVFEYSLLQGLAVTPNLCPVETRTFLNRVPAGSRDACEAFLRQWISFLKKHFDAWKNTLRVGDAPGIAAGEIYSHIRDLGDRGFVCLVNQNPFPRTVRFRLDESIGLAGGRWFTVTQIYPTLSPEGAPTPVPEQPLPAAGWGDELTFELPPHSVRYLAVNPGKLGKGLQVAGPHSRIERLGKGWRLSVRAPQGQVVRLGVVVPKGRRLASVEAQHVPTVPMYTFPARATVAHNCDNVAWIDVTMPRQLAPRELIQWTLEPDGLPVTLPLPGHSGFLGGLVHNAFSEDLDVWVDLTTASGSGAGPAVKAGAVNVAPPVRPSAPPSRMPGLKFLRSRRQRYATRFNLPFIETFATRPGLDDDCVLELAFADPLKVACLTATLNDKPIEVRKYVYPGKSTWHGFYLELTGQATPGEQRLEVCVDWCE